MSVETDGATHLKMAGNLHDQEIEVRLRRLRRGDFFLVNQGFRWVNESPYNR